MAVTVNLLAAWTGLSIRNTNDFLYTHACDTKLSKYSVTPDDVMFVSGSLRVLCEI